jgi:hypothetical protein
MSHEKERKKGRKRKRESEKEKKGERLRYQPISKIDVNQSHITFGVFY